MKKTDINMRYCSLFLLIEIILFLFQSLNGIVSIWGIVPTIITVVIFINIIRKTSGKPKVEHHKLKIVKKISSRKKSNGDVPIEESEKNLYYKELNTKKNSKKGGLAAQIIALIVFLGLGALFIYVGSNQTLNRREKVVKADIYTQQIVYDYYLDTNINRMTISYEYNGFKHRQNIEVKTGVVHTKTIDLIINGESGVEKDEDGFARTAYYLKLYTILAVIMFTCALIMVLSLIFKASGAGVIFTVFFGMGLSLTFVLNVAFFANIFFNAMTVFCWCFMSIGLYGIGCSFFVKESIENDSKPKTVW